jgi:hypothetical protein
MLTLTLNQPSPAKFLLLQRFFWPVRLLCKSLRRWSQSDSGRLWAGIRQNIGTGVSQSTAVEKNPEGARKGNGNARTHGLNTLKDAVTKLGSRALDGRSSLSYALKKWRRELNR